MDLKTRRETLNYIRRTTIVIERAASDVGDEFLSYLYGMAILHLDEPEEERQGLPDSLDVDPCVGELAKKLLASVKPKVR